MSTPSNLEAMAAAYGSVMASIYPGKTALSTETLKREASNHDCQSLFAAAKLFAGVPGVVVTNLDMVAACLSRCPQVDQPAPSLSERVAVLAGGIGNWIAEWKPFVADVLGNQEAHHPEVVAMAEEWQPQVQLRESQLATLTPFLVTGVQNL